MEQVVTPDGVDWSDETWNELYQTHYWQSLCFYLEKYKREQVKGFVNLILLILERFNYQLKLYGVSRMKRISVSSSNRINLCIKDFK